uniref:Transmembrane protein n=1 Tax=Macrostomum lignano TaxID=282301 RepID=A0A1I8I8X2_9PLAT
RVDYFNAELQEVAAVQWLRLAGLVNESSSSVNRRGSNSDDFVLGQRRMTGCPDGCSDSSPEVTLILLCCWLAELTTVASFPSLCQLPLQLLLTVDDAHHFVGLLAGFQHAFLPRPGFYRRSEHGRSLAHQRVGMICSQGGHSFSELLPRLCQLFAFAVLRLRIRFAFLSCLFFAVVGFLILFFQFLLFVVFVWLWRAHLLAAHVLNQKVNKRLSGSSCFPESAQSFLLGAVLLGALAKLSSPAFVRFPLHGAQFVLSMLLNVTVKQRFESFALHSIPSPDQLHATAETACYVHCSLRQPGQPDLTSRPEPLSATDSASCQVQSGGVDGESRWLLTLTGLPRRRVPSVKACRRASRRCDSVIVSGFTRPRRPEADDNDDGLSVDDEVGSTIAVSLAAVAKSLGLPDSAAEDVAANKPTVFVTNVWAYAVLRLRQPSQRLLLIGLRRDRRCRVLVNGKRRSQRSVLYYDWAGGQDDNDGFQPPRLTFSENWPPLVDYPAGESALLLAEPPDSLIRQLMLGDAVATADRLCALNGWSSRGCLVPLVSLEAALRQRQLDTVAFFLNSHEQAPLASLRPALDLMLSYLASLADSPAGRQYADQLAARINRFLCRQLLLADQADSSQAELSLYLSRVRRYCRRPVPQPPPTPLLKASSASLISSSASVGDASSASTSAAAAAASAWSQLADTDVLVDACLSNCVTRALEYFSNSSASRSCTAAHCLTVCRSRVRYLVGRRQLVEARVLLDASGADTERELRDLLLDCADAGLRSWLYLQLAADLPAEVQAAMSSMERLSSAYNTDEARAELRAALLAGEPEAAASESASPLTLRRMLSLAESRVQELLLRRSLAVQSLTDVLDRFPAQAVWRHLLAAGNYRLLSEALDAARPSSDDLDGLHSLPEWLSEPLLCRAAKSGRFSAKEASSRRLWLRRCALAGCLATEAEPLRALLGEALEAGHVTAASRLILKSPILAAQSAPGSAIEAARRQRRPGPESDWPAPEPLREDPSGVSLDSLLPACLAPVEAADKSAGGDAEPPEIGRLPHRYYLANLRPVSAYAVYLAEFFSAASPAASATASPLPLNRRSIRAAVTSVSAEAAAVAGASNSAIDAVTSALVFGHLCGVSDIQCKLRASDIVLAKSVSDAAAAEDPPADLGQLVMQWRCRALAAHLTGRPLPAEPLVQLAANDDWAGFLAAGQLLGYGKPRLLSLLNQFASRPVADHLAHVIEMASSTAPETTRPAEPRQRLYDQLGLTARPRSQQQQQQQSSSTTATVSAQQRRPPKHRRRGRSSSRNVASTLTTTESESSAETAAAVPPSRTPPPPNSDADEASTAPDESEISAVGRRHRKRRLDHRATPTWRRGPALSAGRLESTSAPRLVRQAARPSAAQPAVRATGPVRLSGQPRSVAAPNRRRRLQHRRRCAIIDA